MTCSAPARATNVVRGHRPASSPKQLSYEPPVACTIRVTTVPGGSPMPSAMLKVFFGFLRKARAVQEGAELSDGALLERFLAQRDEAAFEVLVQRHGPMVLGVCQRVLG